MAETETKELSPEANVTAEYQIPPVPQLAPESDEIVAAKQLLRGNGYFLIPYGKITKWIKRCFLIVWRKIRVWRLEWREWCRQKREASALRRQERQKKVEEERIRRAEEETRRAAILKEEVRLAEIRKEEERIKAEDAERQRKAEVLENELRLAEIHKEEERIKAEDAERQRQAEGERRKAEMVKDELRLAELRKQGILLQAATDSPSSQSHSPQCNACGATLVANARFCRKCGAKVVQVVPVSTATDNIAQNQADVAPAE